MNFFKFMLGSVAVCLLLAMACAVLPVAGGSVSEFFLRCATAGAVAAVGALLVAFLVKTTEALAFFGWWPR